MCFFFLFDFFYCSCIQFMSLTLRWPLWPSARRFTQRIICIMYHALTFFIYFISFLNNKSKSTNSHQKILCRVVNKILSQFCRCKNVLNINLSIDQYSIFLNWLESLIVLRLHHKRFHFNYLSDIITERNTDLILYYG